MQLSRLERVELREAWANEAADFTPWLANEENLTLLGETIDMSLELMGQEERVGPFRADILCRDADSEDDHLVLIENQLERTNHRHLGQVVTYAAGLDAATIVWIAPKFTDEHRAALDWLNEITVREFRFFGLEIELWRIGDSSAAPKFNVVSQPNEWIKSSKPDGGGARPMSTNQQLKLAFWQAYREHLQEVNSPVQPKKPLPRGIGMRLKPHRCTVRATYTVKQGRGLEVMLRAFGDGSRDLFLALQEDRDEIESEVGEPLQWRDNMNRKHCDIVLSNREARIDDSADWPAFQRWLQEKMELFLEVFRGRVDTIDMCNTGAD